MPFKKFNEFLNEQKKLKKNKSDKKALGDSGDKSLVYKPSINKYEKIKDKDGLGCVGDQKNVYEPKTEPLQSKAPSSWNKTNVKEWLNKTKKLPLSEFAKNIYEEKNKNVQVDFNKIKNTEDLIENFVKAIKNNPRLIESAARQLNRSNLTESFLAELIKIENSKKISESISDPVGFEGEEDEDDEDHHHHRRSHKHNRMDDESEEDMSDEEGMDDEESEDVGDEEESDYNDEDSEEEDSDYDDEDSDEEEDLDSDDLGHSENDDMENDMPLGRRRKPHSEDYFSDEA